MTRSRLDEDDISHVTSASAAKSGRASGTLALTAAVALSTAVANLPSPVQAWTTATIFSLVACGPDGRTMPARKGLEAAMFGEKVCEVMNPLSEAELLALLGDHERKSYVEIDGITLSGRNLDGMNLASIGSGSPSSQERRIPMDGASLKWATFGHTLQGVDLHGADLSNAKFAPKTQVIYVDLRGADLTGAQMQGVAFMDVTVDLDTKLTGATMSARPRQRVYGPGVNVVTRGPEEEARVREIIKPGKMTRGWRWVKSFFKEDIMTQDTPDRAPTEGYSVDVQSMEDGTKVFYLGGKVEARVALLKALGAKFVD